MPEFLLGLDVGTTSARALVFDPAGKVTGAAQIPLTNANPFPGLVEQDATSRGTGSLRTGMRRDPRWVKIRRPFIVVGGELTLEGLDLVFDDTHKFYEAPFQVKANGGILLIDDFGRQQVRPRDLLNRWIVPLENRVDFLTLHTGRKIEVPFDVLVVFSTNLPPKDLVDEAFLRRLRHKIEIGDPSYEDYREIFRRGRGAVQLRLAKRQIDQDHLFAFGGVERRQSRRYVRPA